MKDAILTLDPKNIEKGASYIQLIAGAIDGDQYAILATMVATGLSLFIELLTIQVLKRVCLSFESVNTYVDEWCITDLQPRIREQVAGKDDLGKTLMRQQAFQQKLLEVERDFQAKLVELHQTSQRHITGLFAGLNQNVEAMQGFVKHTAQKMAEIIPIQESHGKRMDELIAYERQYRSFLDAQGKVSLPRHLKPEIN